MKSEEEVSLQIKFQCFSYYTTRKLFSLPTLKSFHSVLAFLPPEPQPLGKVNDEVHGPHGNKPKQNQSTSRASMEV